MPSPFPGMDPYLENPAVWPGFHHFWIVAAAAQLKTQLKPRGYYVNVDERIWLEDPSRHVYPDLAIVQRLPPEQSQSTAIVDADEPVRVTYHPVEIREGFLEIIDAVNHHLVTGLELLSPANKLQTSGRRLFRKKQRELREADINLVEIDLLRAGKHALSIPQSLAERLRPWTYLAMVWRARDDDIEAYPIPLRNRLPRLRIPLKKGEVDVTLDLQTALNQAYEFGPYPERLDYQSAPTPPFSAVDADWSNDLLSHADLRK